MMLCEECMGEGVIITCCDDLCVGSGHCIHGDGEITCPICCGEGLVPDESDGEMDDYADCSG